MTFELDPNDAIIYDWKNCEHNPFILKTDVTSEIFMRVNTQYKTSDSKYNNYALLQAEGW